MTVRGGGIPYSTMGFDAVTKNGSAASELRCDAHHCIMVWVSVPTAYKDVARMFVHHTRAPLGRRHPDHSKCAVVLGALKDESLRWVLTHPSSCARRRLEGGVGTWRNRRARYRDCPCNANRSTSPISKRSQRSQYIGLDVSLKDVDRGHR